MSQFWQNLRARLHPAVRRTAPRSQHHPALMHGADEAEAALAFVQFAVARAQVALDATTCEGPPPAGIDHTRGLEIAPFLHSDHF